MQNSKPRVIPASELAVGMQVWVPEAWSSHGMKDGYWDRIGKIEIRNYWDMGTVVETDVADFRIDQKVTVR